MWINEEGRVEILFDVSEEGGYISVLLKFLLEMVEEGTLVSAVLQIDSSSRKS